MLRLLLALVAGGCAWCNASSSNLGALETRSSSQNWTRIKMYRITPIHDVGVRDMNTADAPGDVYFGVSQLLLPYLCAEPNEGNMVWCSNRKWLSGGTTWMVYREFDVSIRLPFGVYSPCNPNKKTGVFSCGQYNALLQSPPFFNLVPKTASRCVLRKHQGSAPRFRFRC